MIEIESNSPQQTIELGRKLGSALVGGEIIALTGNLGSGKTHLIKGIAAGAGAEDASSVNSPTFVMVNEYEGRLEIYHIDAWRIESIGEFESLGFDDFCHGGSVVLIEWADKVESALAATDAIRIDLRHAGPSRRIVTIDKAPEYLTTAL